MILIESLNQLFEAKSTTDYADLIIKSAEAIHGNRMSWSPAAVELSQDKAFLNTVRAVAGKMMKNEHDREDLVQDWFLNKFAGVIRSAAASIKKGSYKGDKFLTLVAVSVKHHFINVLRKKKTRSTHEYRKASEYTRALPSKSKRYGGKSRNRAGSFSDERKMFHRVVSDLIKKQSDEKSRQFLTAYFGLATGKLRFSGMGKREALKLAGLEVSNKNETWAGRQIKKALEVLRSNKILQKTIAQEALEGVVSSRMLLAIINEESEAADSIFVEWLVSYIER